MTIGANRNKDNEPCTVQSGPNKERKSSVTRPRRASGESGSESSEDEGPAPCKKKLHSKQGKNAVRARKDRSSSPELYSCTESGSSDALMSDREKTVRNTPAGHKTKRKQNKVITPPPSDSESIFSDSSFDYPPPRRTSSKAIGDKPEPKPRTFFGWPW